MDGTQDFEMPSPKRVRVEAPSPKVASDPALPADDMDHIYGTLPASRASPPRMFQYSSQAVEEMPSTTIEKLPQLPGLDLLHDDLSPLKDDGQADSQNTEVSESALASEPVDAVANPAVIEQEQPQQDGAAEQEQNISHEPSVATAIITTTSVTTLNRNTAENTQPEAQVSDERAPIQKDEAVVDIKLQQATIESKSPEKEATIDTVSELQSMDARAGPNDEAATGLSQSMVPPPDRDGDEGTISESKETYQASGVTALAVSTFEQVAEVNKSNEEAEFEMDSSPLASSSSDVSSDTSSSDDESDAEDYVMLDPIEAARRLMAEDGGSDDDRLGKGGKAISGIPRTLNEKLDEVVPKPNVTITPDLNLEELGLVENLVENLALIKANTSGEYQVLESGSVLCLEDRSVIGIVAETLGRVQQPYYSVRFTNADAMSEAGMTQNTRVFYVKQLSSTVFTQPLKACKGSDASNLHDEEIGDDELEFSDDEAEAEYKRQVKLQKRAKHEARHGQADGFSHGPQGAPGGASNGYSRALPSWPEQPPKSEDLPLNYDDVKEEDDDNLYTPLARPLNLHEMMAGKPPSVERNVNRGSNHRAGRDRGGHDWGRGGRGRGNRGSDRGGRGNRRDQGGRGGNRGGNRGGSQNPNAQPREDQGSPSMPQRNGFSQPLQNSLPPRPPQNNGYFPPPGQGNSFQPHQSPQQLPMQPPGYLAQSQAQSYLSYPAQYVNGQGQSYPQAQQYQNYPSQYPQQQYNYQYYPSHQSTPQNYQLHQSFAYPQHTAQQTSPTPLSPSKIPPGAHINPNFFRQQAQSQQQSWPQQPPPADGDAHERLGYTSNSDCARYI